MYFTKDVACLCFFFRSERERYDTVGSIDMLSDSEEDINSNDDAFNTAKSIASSEGDLWVLTVICLNEIVCPNQ